MLRKTRIVSQVVFFAIFAACFFFITVPSRSHSTLADLFLRLNPLVGLLTSIASRTFIVSVAVTGIVVAVLTMVFGRFFCGFVCPLGASIDFSDRYIFKATRSAGRRPPRYLQRLKHVLLFGLLVLALFGAVLPLFMDPISLLTRIFTIAVNPLLNLLGVNFIVAAGPLLGALGLEKLRLMTLKTPLFYGIPFVIVLVALVYGGSFWDRRFWCQYVCPSGALFGLLSRFALFRRTRDAGKCNSCGACSRVCPTRAIEMTNVERTNTAECLVCGLCTQIKEGCSGFRFSAPATASIAGPDLKRRHLLLGAVGGIALAPVLKASAIVKTDFNGRLIRPPGAIPENDFLGRCIACGNCMKVCPTNTLQPCTLTDGWSRLYTPRLVPRVAACDSKCSACGHVCPTGALHPYPPSEKPYIKIGTAVVDRHRCLAWEQNKECLVCNECCPYNAIEPRLVETTKGPFRVPVVNELLCMGCGMCEMQCPIFDRAAIEVYRFGENRLFAAPYASASKKRKLDEMRVKSNNIFFTGNKSHSQ